MLKQSFNLNWNNSIHWLLLNDATQGSEQEGIIEDDQIKVTDFSLEYFSYLTGHTLGQWERKPNSVVRFQSIGLLSITDNYA